MAREKSRSYQNPVIVKMTFDDGKAVSVEVSDYQVTSGHVILTRKNGDSRVTKYVALSALRTFEFDAPADWKSPAQPVTWQNAPMWTLNATPPMTYTSTPGFDGSPVFTPNPVVDRVQKANPAGIKVVPKPTPDVPTVESENDLVKTAMAGREVARMT